MSIVFQPVYRLACLDDLPAIVDIYNSTIVSREVTADLEPVSVESRLPWFQAHQQVNRPIWVVDGPQGVAGWLSFSDFHTRLAYRHTAEVSIYLHPNARGQGLGAYFLEQAILAAPEMDIRTLIGLIFGHNTRSLRLFARFGFERWADMPRVAQLDDLERDLVIVGRRVA